MVTPSAPIFLRLQSSLQVHLLISEVQLLRDILVIGRRDYAAISPVGGEERERAREKERGRESERERARESELQRNSDDTDPPTLPPRRLHLQMCFVGFQNLNIN